ncbi:MAG: hypothetical protein KY459_15850 [Acidobacteria bacterium]|nr:hypothetical protein [Acidobacteriota bacterium]
MSEESISASPTDPDQPRIHVVSSGGTDLRELESRFVVTAPDGEPDREAWTVELPGDSRLDPGLCSELRDLTRAGDGPIVMTVRREYRGRTLALPPSEEIVMSRPRSCGAPRRARNPVIISGWKDSSSHRRELERRFVPHSMIRRILLFVSRAYRSRVLDPNTLRYLWIEAGFDHAGISGSVESSRSE